MSSDQEETQQSESTQKFDTWSPSSFKLSQSQIDAAIAASEASHRRYQGRAGQCTELCSSATRIHPRFGSQVCSWARKMSLSAVLAREEAYSASTRGMVLILNCGYIPGGRYPLLASAHMTILTAKAAGVQHVIGCTPPRRPDP